MLNLLNRSDKKIKLTKEEQNDCYEIANDLIYKYISFEKAGVQKTFDMICSAYRVLKLVNEKHHVDSLDEETYKYMSLFKKQVKSLSKYGIELDRYSLKTNTFQLILMDKTNKLTITLSIK